MLPSRRLRFLVYASLGLSLSASTGFAISSLVQGGAPKRGGGTIKLEHGAADTLHEVSEGLRPAALSAKRLIVPVGDTLYMLDDKSRVAWEYSFEPNVILDFLTTPAGTIYVATTDGLLVELDSSGKKLWGNFMCGSANYNQLANFDGGVLTVTSMETYRRDKGLDAEDILQLWRGGKVVWRKDFPRGARLHVWGEKILAVTRTKDGREITEIR